MVARLDRAAALLSPILGDKFSGGLGVFEGKLPRFASKTGLSTTMNASCGQVPTAEAFSKLKRDTRTKTLLFLFACVRLAACLSFTCEKREEKIPRADPAL